MPFNGLFLIHFDAESNFVQFCKLELGIRITLFCGCFIPLGCFGRVFLYTIPELVATAKCKLCCCISLLCRRDQFLTERKGLFIMLVI